MTITEEIRRQLLVCADPAYREFNATLNPTLDSQIILGIRTPVLRKLAKEYASRPDIDEFLDCLPHHYFEENQLHAFIIALTPDFATCLSQVNAFLPYIDNWGTCDQLSPRVFAKNHLELLPSIFKWLTSMHPYTVRFAIKMLMDHFLEADYDAAYPKLVASIRSDHYYVRMMAAWYFATALAFRYREILPFFQANSLPLWTHNKAIQKACESRRIPDEHKQKLRSLRRKKPPHNKRQ